MMKPQKVIGTTVLVAGLALLAGCGEDEVADLDRLDAAPAARVSADAIDPPDDERVITSDAIEDTQEGQGY